MEKAPYLDLLEKTADAVARGPEPGSETGQAALARFCRFFENMTPEQVESTVEEVYAPEAWLYDTLVLHHGIGQIKPYFIATAKRASGVQVEVLDTLTSGKDVFIKWRMDIKWSAFRQKGRVTTSFGMSHLRFDESGRVVMHYDFWDSAHGFFEHLPVVGGLIRFIKRKVAGGT